MKSSKRALRQIYSSLRELTQREHVVLTGRGAAAMWAALTAWGIRDQVVLIPANTCYIVLWAVLKSGNHPLLVDVDAQTGSVTVAGLDAALASNPAAIIPCHMYGLPAPMATIYQWAKANSVKVIEDAALALGAVVDGRPAGSWGDASILSFGLGKVVDQQVGGALVTSDPILAHEAARLMADAPLWDDHLLALTNQWNSLYWALHQFESQNPRLLTLYPQLWSLYEDLVVYRLADDDWSELPALLQQLPDNLARRAHLAALYDAEFGFDGTRDENALIATLWRQQGAILWRYPLLVRAALRDELLSHLWEQGIHEATKWYPALRPMASVLAPHLTQAQTPAAEAFGASIINLPLGEGVDESDVARTVAVVTRFLRDAES